MGVKGVLKPDSIPANKYVLSIAAFIPIVVTSVSAIEQEVDNVELPDRTRVTGGNTKPPEFTLMTPLHHTAEYFAMEAWYAEGQDPVTPTYKKLCTLQMISPTGAIMRTYAISGCWIKSRKLPELSMDNEGEITLVEWSMSADQVLFLP